jgi:hypothetical protein
MEEIKLEGNKIKLEGKCIDWVGHSGSGGI